MLAGFDRGLVEVRGIVPRLRSPSVESVRVINYAASTLTLECNDAARAGGESGAL